MYIIEYTTRMSHLKIVSTDQGHIQKYEDLKRKICNCNVIIYFNRKCLRKNIIPNFCQYKNTKYFLILEIYTKNISTIIMKD